MFEGVIENIYSNFYKIILKSDKLTDVATLKKNGLSLEDRYIQSASIPNSMKSIFKKQEGWKIAVDDSVYNISSIVFGDLNSDGTRQLDITLESPIRQSINSRAYITADTPFHTTNNISEKSGYSMSMEAEGGLVGNAYGFIRSNVLCLDGEYFSNPYVLDIPYDARIGICEGYLFGMEINGSAESRIGAITLVTTPRAYRGIASFFNFLRQEDWVAFQDPVTQKIVIRRGSLNFTDYPMKNMIVIGEDVLTEKINGGEYIYLNNGQEWLRRIQLKLPDAKEKLQLGITFGIGDIQNIYGFYISGQGKINLQLLKREGINPYQLSTDIYRGYGYYVSPVYLYSRNFYESLENNFIDIGIRPNEGPIYFRLEDGSNNVDSVNISSVITQYIKDNQTLENIDYYDLIKTQHGENLFIYGTSIGAFKIGDIVNNSGSNKWDNLNAVMIIGGYDEDYTWCSPMTHGENSNNKNQNALMVLNGVDYMSSIYNPLNNSISLFVKAYSNKVSYIGCLIISLINLKKTNYLCVPISPSSRNFLWRPPSLPDEFISNSDRSWTDSANIIDDGYSYKADEENGTEDIYVRVMGSGLTKSKVVIADDPGIISTHILPDGTYVLLYDSNAGIRAIYSNDCGLTWYKSDLVYAKNSRSACLVGKYLFYITTSGIEIKLTNYYDFYRGLSIAMEKKAGNNINNFEQSTQELLDNLDHVLIGSGKIEFQRLSGYITYDGTIKIFYYDNNSLLRCMESKDSLKWSMADNF